MNSEEKNKVNPQSSKEKAQKLPVAKKRTLKQLEGDLEYYKSFIDKCVDSCNENNYSMAFSMKDKPSVTYEDIQKLPLEERYEWANGLINDKEFFDGREENENIHKAIRVLYLLGFRNLAGAVHKMSVDYSVSKHYQPKIESIQAQIKHKKMTSKGGVNRTSHYKDIALKIAGDTWMHTPGASMETLAKKIHDHLSKKRTDIPEPSTIKTWLKKSGLNPNVSPKIQKYELVISTNVDS
ncbi:hypothetical protein ACKWMY_28010 [Serratia sp. J2]|uniref:hypothetical protein n=1 Tax=Serratia sp. J2 TaxID=3386551 RepID=UPI0039174064